LLPSSISPQLHLSPAPSLPGSVLGLAAAAGVHSTYTWKHP